MEETQTTKQELHEIKTMLVDFRAYMEAALNGQTVGNTYVPGIMPRLGALENKVATLEQNRTWAREKVATLVLSIASAVGSAWAVMHTR